MQLTRFNPGLVLQPTMGQMADVVAISPGIDSQDPPAAAVGQMPNAMDDAIEQYWICCIESDTPVDRERRFVYRPAEADRRPAELRKPRDVTGAHTHARCAIASAASPMIRRKRITIDDAFTVHCASGLTVFPAFRDRARQAANPAACLEHPLRPRPPLRRRCRSDRIFTLGATAIAGTNPTSPTTSDPENSALAGAVRIDILYNNIGRIRMPFPGTAVERKRSET